MCVLFINVFRKRMSENAEIDFFSWEYLVGKTFFFTYVILLNSDTVLSNTDMRAKWEHSSPSPTGCSVPKCVSACRKQLAGLRPAVEMETTATKDNYC